MPQGFAAFGGLKQGELAGQFGGFGGEGVAQEMRKLGEVTQSIDKRMGDMVSASEQIDKAVSEVNAVAKENTESIENLVSEVGKFKM